MQRTIIISLRAAFAVAIMCIASLAIPAVSSAQDGTEYDVRVKSGAEGQAGEFPLSYTVNYDNGTSEDVTIDGEGTQARTSPAGVGNVVSIIYRGTVIIAANDIYCTPRDASGGCWCLCLKWARDTWFPWIIRPIFVWYYDPCCK